MSIFGTILHKIFGVSPAAAAPAPAPPRLPARPLLLPAPPLLRPAFPPTPPPKSTSLPFSTT